MNKLKIRNRILSLGLIAVSILAIGGVVFAYSGSSVQNVAENGGTINVYNSSPSLGGSEMLGAAAASNATYLSQYPKPTAFGTTFVNGDFEVSGSSYLDGTLSLTGGINYEESYTESVATTNTLTAAMSGETFYLSGATSTYVLPATTTSDGLVYRFVVDGAMTVDQTIVTNDGSNIIEGALIVAGAVVDCDAEDTITIVADGENIGDFVELRSDGDYWFIGASGALTSSKMTCSTST